MFRAMMTSTSNAVPARCQSLYEFSSIRDWRADTTLGVLIGWQQEHQVTAAFVLGVSALDLAAYRPCAELHESDE